MTRAAPIALVLLFAGCARVELDEAQVAENFQARHPKCAMLRATRAQPDDTSIHVTIDYRCPEPPAERRLEARYTYFDGRWDLWGEFEPGTDKQVY